MRIKLLTHKIGNAMPGFLTLLGIVGIVGTAVSAAYDTIEAAKKLEEAKYDHMTKVETIKHVAPCYGRTALIATGTSICVAGANILNKRQQASIISAYGVLNQRYLNFRHATKEVVGDEKLQEIDAKLAELEAKKQEIERENGKLLFYEPVTQTFFHATKYEVRDAEYKFNRTLYSMGVGSIKDFIEYLPFTIDNITEKRIDLASSYGWSYDYFAEWRGGEFWTVDFTHIERTLPDGTVYYQIYYDSTPIDLDYDVNYNFEEYPFDSDYYKRGEGFIME